MVKKTSMVLVLTMIILLSAGPYAAGRPVDYRLGRVALMPFTGDITVQKHLILAASDKVAEDSQTDSEAEKNTEEVPDPKKTPTQTTPKPLKPFVPSEKVKAGQSVDFPYDI